MSINQDLVEKTISCTLVSLYLVELAKLRTLSEVSTERYNLFAVVNIILLPLKSVTNFSINERRLHTGFNYLQKLKRDYNLPEPFPLEAFTSLLFFSSCFHGL